MVNIAVYGKGGIGKSTVSSNTSFSLSEKGLRITQLGCDPKHDSTITLLDGVEQPTVLDYVKRVPPSQRSLDDIVITGVNGIKCIEAGGPQPGIGCAGRGILTTFDTLKELGIMDIPSDVTVFDVLGDVVCGGFAVPMRKEHTDAIFVVTSGEFMAMYAANNILRGMMNFDPRTPRVAGIILNRRGMDNEYERVKKLSEAVGVPIVADIPRAPEFKQATYQKKTVSEAFPDSEPARIFDMLADMVLEIDAGKRKLYSPHPLDDEQLDRFGKGQPTGVGMYDPAKKCCADATNTNGMCASMGAAHEAGRIVDLPVIIHGPMSCGHIMNMTIEAHYMMDFVQNPVMNARRLKRFVCTDMQDSSSIFGGNVKLMEALNEVKEGGHNDVLIITTCVTGMIGDDLDHIVEEFKKENPGFNVMVALADGNHSGPSSMGRQLVLDAYYGLIDQTKEPTEMAVNLIDSSFMGFDQGRNELWYEQLMDMMGLKLGTKIFAECTLEQVRNCKSNKLNIMVGDTTINSSLKLKFEEMGFDIFPVTLPHGYSETVEWMRAVADYLGEPGKYDGIIGDITAEYTEAVAKYRPMFEGKVIDIVLMTSGSVDWMIEALRDAGARVRSVRYFGIHSIGNSFYSRYSDEVQVFAGQSYKEIIEAENNDLPDVIISDNMFRKDLKGKIVGGSSEVISHRASIEFLEKIANMMLMTETPGWTKWRCIE